jgi:hypothetical protein
MLRRRHLQAATGAAIVAMGLAASTLSASATGPIASASPRWHLTNGATTWVQASSFPPGVTVAIVQCNQKIVTLKSQNACDTSHPVLTQSTSTGRVAARAYKVVEGNIGTGAGKGPCDAAHSCFMVVANIANTKQAAVAPIHFG